MAAKTRRKTKKSKVKKTSKEPEVKKYSIDELAQILGYRYTELKLKYIAKNIPIHKKLSIDEAKNL
jgi:hypothetical protein